MQPLLYFDWVQQHQDCLTASRRQFNFYHYVPRNPWYSIYGPRKDERLNRSWSQCFWTREPWIANPALWPLRKKTESQSQTLLTVWKIVFMGFNVKKGTRFLVFYRWTYQKSLHCARGRWEEGDYGVEPPTKFSNKWGFERIFIKRGLLGKEGWGELFQRVGIFTWKTN